MMIDQSNGSDDEGCPAMLRPKVSLYDAFLAAPPTPPHISSSLSAGVEPDQLQAEDQPLRPLRLLELCHRLPRRLSVRLRRQGWLSHAVGPERGQAPVHPGWWRRAHQRPGLLPQPLLVVCCYWPLHQDLGEYLRLTFQFASICHSESTCFSIFCRILRISWWLTNCARRWSAVATRLLTALAWPGPMMDRPCLLDTPTRLSASGKFPCHSAKR